MGGTTSFRILGHRGGAGAKFPENSIQAFQYGLKAGADGIELDVRLSRDNRVMVVHDPMIDRVSQGAGAVEELGAAELRRYALLDGYGTPHKDTKVPVLEELYELFETAYLNIDLKTTEARLARAVMDIIRRYDAVERTTVASFDPATLRFFRSIAPEIPTSADPSEIRALVKSRLLREPVDIPARRIQLPVRYRLLPVATRGFTRFLHGEGFAVDVWVVNTPRIALKISQNGVDGIITDDVSTIRNALSSGGSRDDS